MGAFTNELTTLVANQERAQPTSGEGAYSMPWYLVVGTPGTGRTTAIKALNMSWPFGDGPVAQGLCTYWMPEKAVFIEPEAQVLGQNRQHGLLDELCGDIKARRPREPVDGLVLIVSAQLIADSTEDGVDEYATSVRREVIEINQAFGTDVPIYVVVTAYDTLWGFGDAFRWTSERRDEDPWGFSMPFDTATKDVPDRMKQEIEGLTARVESMCFSRLSGDETAPERMRSFQHLSEARDMLNKLGDFMRILAMDNAFERAPWVRGLAIGSGVPGTGHRLRHNAQQMASMGLQAPQQSGTPTPGGMPLHQYLDDVLIPERDLVPTRMRWRDDIFLMLMFMFGFVLWLGLIILYFATP